jgi:hypothetical protein
MSQKIGHLSARRGQERIAWAKLAAVLVAARFQALRRLQNTSQTSGDGHHCALANRYNGQGI